MHAMCLICGAILVDPGDQDASAGERAGHAAGGGARASNARPAASRLGLPTAIVKVARVPARGAVCEMPVAMQLPRRILVPLDLGDHAAEVLDYAVALAAKLDAKLHVLHSIAWPLIGTDIPISLSDKALSEIVARARVELGQLVTARTEAALVGSVEVQTGDPRNVIVADAARWSADLIVMGTHGRRGVARMWLGSVAEQVARVAPCPVLFVRSGTAAAR